MTSCGVTLKPGKTFMKYIALLLILLMLAACGAEQEAAPRPSGSGVTPVVALKSKLLTQSSEALPQAGDPAPDFEFTLENGTTTKLSDLRGKKVIVNFWATW